MTPTFYRAAAVASIISAVTTVILIFAPQFYAAVPDGLPGRVHRVVDPAYQMRAWTYLLHPFVAGFAAVAVAIAIRRVAPVLALVAALGFLLWAFTEAAQQCLTLFAFDDWRRAWLVGDPIVRETMELRIAIYDGVWEAAYSLLLFGIIIGSAALAAALLRMSDGLSRAVGGLFVLASLQSILLQSAELGGPALPDSLAYWIYPATQPLARLLIGLWLLRVARNGEFRVGAPA